MRNKLRFAVWLWPHSRAKIWVLNRLGYEIDSSATVGACLFWHVDKVKIGPGASVQQFNAVRNLRLFSLEQGALLGSYNFISAAPPFAIWFPKSHHGELKMAPYAKIASRHTIDCSGRVSIGTFSSIAGHNTTFLTHSTDLRLNAQVARPIVIGDRSFVGTNSIVLGGAVLPARSILAAGSLLTASRSAGNPGLWAGMPAKWKSVTDGLWFDREETRTTSVADSVSGEQIVDAF
ncbi:acyltransferase [Cryobacterium melibiosiphilum]|uniref:acyltransferase n=1 Tax=Cryobacterium melibiosiphilum TaxID=995039 RepID=UPI0011C23457|nr:hypothetical protein [Cryobacterium melibiosiphilum]